MTIVEKLIVAAIVGILVTIILAAIFHRECPEGQACVDRGPDQTIFVQVGNVMIPQTSPGACRRCESVRQEP